MRGPGGGGKGGGFGRSGGSSGGGFGRGPSGGYNRGPGGYGGYRPPHHHHHHHHYRPFFFGYRRPYYGYGYGGGCLGGALGIILLPIILIIIAISLIGTIFGSVGNSFNNIKNGGSIIIDYDVMEDYACEQYDIEFADAVYSGDNILILFLVDEECEGFQTIAIVGSNVDTKIDKMFGNETTEFGVAMLGNIKESGYRNSLSKNLAAVVEEMKEKIVDLSLTQSFVDDKGSPGDYNSHVVNQSNLTVSEETINRALVDFTEETDIPITVVIADYEDVFEKSYSGTDYFVIILAIALGGVAIYMFVRAFKENKENNPEGFNDDNGVDNSNSEKN